MPSTRQNRISSIVDSCSDICLKIHGIVDDVSEPILHRSKWRCLARSYSVVVEVVRQRVQHDWSMLEPHLQETLSIKLAAPLEALSIR